MYQSHYSVPLSYDLTTFYILGQKFVNFFVGFLENLRYQKDILKLIDLYSQQCVLSLGTEIQRAVKLQRLSDVLGEHD